MKSGQTPTTPAEWEKIYLDSSDSRSIHSGKGFWGELGQGIVQTVENKITSAGKYPTAKLNSDGSLSFFLGGNHHAAQRRSYCIYNARRY